MGNRNKYAALDDIGFIGIKSERSKVEQEQDAKLTSDYIKNYHAAHEGKVETNKAAGKKEVIVRAKEIARKSVLLQEKKQRRRARRNN